MFEVKQTQLTVKDGKFPTDQDFVTWIVDQAETFDLSTLLAFADDGVIWGYFQYGKWKLSGTEDSFNKISPPLSPATLQQAHLFGKNCELLIWRTETGLIYRTLQEGQGTPTEYYDAKMLLWGEPDLRPESIKAGFVLFQEGKQGLQHTPPVDALQVKSKKTALVVRNYIAYDLDEQGNGTGQAYVHLSRLVGLA